VWSCEREEGGPGCRSEVFGGFGSHYMTTRLADVFLLVSVLVLIASILAHVGRWQLSLASTLMLALWVGSEMVA
jgi:hypothetical protein